MAVGYVIRMRRGKMRRNEFVYFLWSDTRSSSFICPLHRSRTRIHTVSLFPFDFSLLQCHHDVLKMNLHFTFFPCPVIFCEHSWACICSARLIPFFTSLFESHALNMNTIHLMSKFHFFFISRCILPLFTFALLFGFWCAFMWRVIVGCDQNMKESKNEGEKIVHY